MNKSVIVAVHCTLESDIALVARALETNTEPRALAVRAHAVEPGQADYQSFGVALKHVGTLAWQSAGAVPGADLGVSIVRTHFWARRRDKEVRRSVVLVAVATRDGPIIGSVPLDIIPGDMLPDCNAQVGQVVREWNSVERCSYSDDTLQLGQHVANVLLHTLTLEPTEEAYTIN